MWFHMCTFMNVACMYVFIMYVCVRQGNTGEAAAHKQSVADRLLFV